MAIDFKVTEELSSKETCKVYRGVDSEGHNYIKKEFFFPDGKGTKVWKNFEKEVSILKSLNHPSIPKLYEYSEFPFYIIMEDLQDPSLRKLMDDGILFSQQEVIDIAKKALNILEYVHSYNIVHKDVNPNNILYNYKGNYNGDKKVSLTDVGIAKIKNISKTTTSLDGTLQYMAPEQLYGKSDFSTDIYCLGATLVELLTRDTIDNFTEGDSITNMDVKLPNEIEPRLRAILSKMVTPKREHRYKTARDALDDFEILSGNSNGQLKFNISPLSNDGKTEETNITSSKIIDELILLYYSVTQDNQVYLKPTFLEKLKLLINYFECHDEKIVEKIYSRKEYDIFIKQNQKHSLDMIVTTNKQPYVWYLKLNNKENYQKFKDNIETYLIGDEVENSKELGLERICLPELISLKKAIEKKKGDCIVELILAPVLIGSSILFYGLPVIDRTVETIPLAAIISGTCFGTIATILGIFGYFSRKSYKKKLNEFKALINNDEDMKKLTPYEFLYEGLDALKKFREHYFGGEVKLLGGEVKESVAQTEVKQEVKTNPEEVKQEDKTQNNNAVIDVAPLKVETVEKK